MILHDVGTTNAERFFYGLMFKMAEAGDDHGHVCFVAIVDAVLVLDGSAWMDHGGDTCFVGDLYCWAARDRAMVE